jgi:hypothetical protein
MQVFRLFAAASAIGALVAGMSFSPADAQTRRAAARAAPPVQAAAQVAAAPQEKCLRALNGECTNPVVVEAVRVRAMILPAVTVSYFGTPAGSIGGDYIPFERFFQDNPILFGLPTNSLIVPGCCVRRTK